MSSRDGKRMGILGKSGSGKTFFAQRCIRENNRLVILDPKHSGSWKAYAKDNNIYVANGLADLVDVISDNRDGTFRILYCPNPETRFLELHGISEVLERLQRKYMNMEADDKVTLLIDELHMLNPLHDNYKNGNGFLRLVTMGREYGINIIGITQRPQNISMDFRDNVDRVCGFKVAGTKPAKAVTDMCDGNEEVYKALLDLNPYHHVYYEEGDWQVMPPVV